MSTISGTTGVDTLTGTDLADILNGLDGADILTALGGNDTLNGGKGNDTMYGGAGNDTYIVDAAGDMVIELANEGIDTVKTSITYTLTDNVENLLLTGTGTINGTGNALANKITGNAGDNTLTGLGGNDTLDGGKGNDKMYGGAGNDTYIVDAAGDTVSELANEGTDTVKASITYALTTNVENLLLTGTAAINGSGNSLGNKITGNAGDNSLSGLGGNDTIIGGAGNDTITGGAGRDTMTGGIGNDSFVFGPSDFSSKTSTGADSIADFTAGDKIDLSAIDALVSASGYGASGNQAFHFIGSNGFHNHTGAELRYAVVSGNTYVYGNMDGDTTADFCIKLDGVHTLSSADFVL